jgi:alpha-ketoglutarate-dependent taurine dioxygenase
MIWDNRCTTHQRGAFNPHSCRLLHRVVVNGERPA